MRCFGRLETRTLPEIEDGVPLTRKRVRKPVPAAFSEIVRLFSKQLSLGSLCIRDRDFTPSIYRRWKSGVNCWNERGTPCTSVGRVVVNPSGVSVFHHSLVKHVVVEVVLELVHVQTNGGGIGMKVFVFELILMGKQLFVHLPERSLSGCSLRRHTGLLGVGVAQAKGQMPKDVSERGLISVFLFSNLQDSLKVPVNLPTRRTLIVPILHDGHWGIRGPVDVIVRAYGRMKRIGFVAQSETPSI